MVLKERENSRLKGFFKVLGIFNSLMLFFDSTLDNVLGARLKKKETNPSLQTAMPQERKTATMQKLKNFCVVAVFLSPPHPCPQGNQE